MRTFIFLFLICCGTVLHAQSYTVVAYSLRLPTGLELDAQGRLWVVESGYGFDDGAVSVMLPGGALAPVVVGLPSVYDTATQENVGPWHTLMLPNNRLAVTNGVADGVYLFDLTGFTPGVTPPMSPSDSTGFLHIRDFVFQQGFAESDPYTVARDAAGNLYVADAAANAVIKVQTSGQLSMFNSFPAQPNPLPFGPPFYDAVPTRILAKPGGGFYLCQLTGFPFLDSAATIFSIDPNGAVSPYALGLTMMTDLVLDAATGDLYALQLGRFDLSIFDIAPNSARIIRIQPNGARTVVVENFNLGVGLALDTQGNLYATELASGRILKWSGLVSAVAEKSNGLSGVSLAPNPTAGQTRISFSLNRPETVQIRVLDAGGRVVYAQDLGVRSAGLQQAVWPGDGTPAGLYWVEIQTTQGLSSLPLVRQ